MRGLETSEMIGATPAASILLKNRVTSKTTQETEEARKEVVNNNKTIIQQRCGRSTSICSGSTKINCKHFPVQLPTSYIMSRGGK